MEWRRRGTVASSRNGPVQMDRREGPHEKADWALVASALLALSVFAIGCLR